MTQPPNDDPDAENLPPGAELPERAEFVRTQHWARAVTSLVALGVVVLIWLFARKNHDLYATCAGLIAVSCSWHFFRYFRPAK